MGQGDIIDLLRKKKREMTTKEIASKLGVATSSTLVNLRKLASRDEISRKKTPNGYLYKIK